MKVMGLISGTSFDGIDVAVVDVDADSVPGTLRLEVVHTGEEPYTADLVGRISAALPPAATTLAEVCELDTLIGQSFAGVASRAVEASGPVDLVCSHGQTVFHWVEDGAVRGTLQLGQPAWIAEATGVPVVADVRIRDITRGGQGAPLVSHLDALLLAGLGGRAAALNLGGIANMTLVVDGADPVAFDIGPANALIDAVVSESGVNGLGYDRDGLVARAGTVSEPLLEVLLAEPYYDLPIPKSTGKELFHGRYLDEAVARAGVVGIDTADLVATVTELTVRTVARAVSESGATTLVASGGGVRNPVIMEGLAGRLPDVRLVTSDALGVPSDAKEAIAFALIGWLTAHGMAGTVPSATGASRASVLGAVTPASDGRLPVTGTIAVEPTALEIVSAHDRKEVRA